MTQEEILKGNILVAEFMGAAALDKSSMLQDPSLVFNMEHPVRKEGLVYIGKKQLAYHSSWDWLMPVVEKIMDYCFENDGEEDLITKFYDIRDTIPDIHRTWSACVYFVKWYNQNKS